MNSGALPGRGGGALCVGVETWNSPAPFMELRMNTDQLRRYADRVVADYNAARASYRDERLHAEELRGRLEDALTAQRILQETAAAVQASAHEQIAAIVTRCLTTVFGDDAYTFVVRFTERRGKTEADLLFVRDGVEYDPVTSAGGGVIDVAAFALRLAALVLERPARRRLMVLDEPFRHLSRDYAERVRELIEVLTRELDLQIIMVTHTPQLAAGKVVQL